MYPHPDSVGLVLVRAGDTARNPTIVYLRVRADTCLIEAKELASMLVEYTTLHLHCPQVPAWVYQTLPWSEPYW